MNRDEIIRWMNGHLKPKRVRHCLGTEQAAGELARRWGCDEEKAELSGLVHDCAKSLPVEEMAVRAARAGFAVDRLSRGSTGILHAPAGADVARLELGIADEEVLSAVFWHTVPHLEMTKLETVVSLADMIEPNRDYDGLDTLRALAMEDLDEAFRQSLARCIAHVAQGGWVLHPCSVEVYNALTLRREGR